MDKVTQGVEELSVADRERRGSQMTGEELKKSRRRLSLINDPKSKGHQLDGYQEQADTAETRDSIVPSTGSVCYATYAKRSDVGIVPFNQYKVNQDRPLIETPFMDDNGQALFGVFDGHGSVGHEVSQFVIEHMATYVSELFTKDPEAEPESVLENAFLTMNKNLATSPIDCAFSGTTAVMTYIKNKTAWCANAGDSRAVLGQLVDGKIIAVDMSDDHKPEREDEKARIIKSGGRVEACKGYDGSDVGPARVWLKKQDVPGLAMTRSFGDQVAASVGVTARPDVKKFELDDSCLFMVIASDGVWEFLSSQDSVDIIGAALKECGTDSTSDKKKGAVLACDRLVDESVRQWKQEEEVVDDTTCVIVVF